MLLIDQLPSTIDDRLWSSMIILFIEIWIIHYDFLYFYSFQHDKSVLELYISKKNVRENEPRGTLIQPR